MEPLLITNDDISIPKLNLLKINSVPIKKILFWHSHFTTTSGHLIAKLHKYINIFHKTEVQMIILKCLTCLNLNWIKGYDMKHNFFLIRVFQFCKKIPKKLYVIPKGPFYDGFCSFFYQLHKYLSQKWGSDSHFEVLSVSKS